MQYDKLGAGLSSLVEAHRSGGKAAMRGFTQEFGVVANDADLKPARISVTIECDEDANLDHLARYGISVNQKQGSIRTAFLPVT
ncbi:MAG TPA: peptidase S8, partial [Allocoleopsis sp.]